MPERRRRPKLQECFVGESPSDPSGPSRLTLRRNSNCPWQPLEAARDIRPSLTRGQLLFQSIQLLQCGLFLQEPVVDAACVECAARLIGELIEVGEEVLDLSLDGHQ